jgi:hypothetical protein
LFLALETLLAYQRAVPRRQQGRQLPLDRVQLADQFQRPVGPLVAALGGRHELAAGVRPAAAVLDPVGAVQPLVLGQGIGLEVAPVARQETLRPLGRVAHGEVEHGIGVVGLADYGPQVRLGGAIRPLHPQLHRGVIAVQHPRAQQPLMHQLDQRPQQGSGPAQPAAQGRARQRYP